MSTSTTHTEGRLDARSGPPAADPHVHVVHELMTSAEVADLLRVSQATLCRWRERGTGPRVYWLSPRAPRYAWPDVEQWLDRSRS